MTDQPTFRLAGEPTALVINAGGTWALKFTPDGKIEGNPDVPTDEAARAIIEALRPYFRSLGNA